MTNFDALSFTPAAAGNVRSDRQMADVRARGWLLELERALLELGSRQNRAAGEKKETSTNADRPDAAAASDPFAKQASGHGVTSDADDGIAGQKVTTKANGKPAEAANENRAKADSDGEEDVPGAARKQTSGTRGLTDGRASELPMQYPNASAWVAAQSTFMAPQNQSQPRPGAIESIGRSSAAVRPDSRSTPAFRLSPPASEKPQLPNTSDSMADVAGDPAQAGGADDAQTPTGEYTRRQFHLYRGEDGMHAWVRDAELTDEGARALALALSGELNSSGERLAALTFNGKKVMASSHGGAGNLSREVLAEAKALVNLRGDRIDNKDLTVKGEF